MINKKEDNSVPCIKTVRRRKPKNPKLGLYLTNEEKSVLVRKYVSEGMDIWEARKKMKDHRDKLNGLIKEMKIKKKSDSEISIRFKEEFAKLVDR